MTLNRLDMCADLINRDFFDYSILDVGCRTKSLEPLLKKCKKYSGIDKNPGDEILECNLENGLPYDDDSFDIVVALDVLEHLEDAYMIYKDMLRVARKAVFVSLPNMYYWSFRLNFLIGKGISGKYTFPEAPPQDRHRWLLSYQEALSFINKNSVNHKIEHHNIIPERGRTKLISEPLQKWLAAIWPNLFVYGTLSIIRIRN